MTCTVCGNEMTYYDTIKRIVLYAQRKRKIVYVKRFRCSSCDSVKRMLPDFIFPYKHYAKEIIEGVIAGDINCNTDGYEDYPCEMTMKRWITHSLCFNKADILS